MGTPYTNIVAVMAPDGPDMLFGPFHSKQDAEANIATHQDYYDALCLDVEDETGVSGTVAIWTVNTPPTHNDRKLL